MRPLLVSAILIGVLGPAALVPAEEGDSAAIKAELQRLQGSWQRLSLTLDGKDLPLGDGKQIAVIQGDTMRGPGEGKTEVIATLKIDPTAKPHTVDIILRSGQAGGRILKGIYKLEGDFLTICYGQEGKPRPGDFEEKQAGTSLMVLKRVSPPKAREAKPIAGPRWEYRVLSRGEITDLGKGDLTTGLNALGQEGWELVGIEGAAASGREASFYFKRPIREGPRGAAPLQAPWPLADSARVELKVIQLRNADATALARTLEQLLQGMGGKTIRIISDVASNTLLVAGDTDQIRVVEALVQRLDVSR